MRPNHSVLLFLTNQNSEVTEREVIPSVPDNTIAAIYLLQGTSLEPKHSRANRWLIPVDFTFVGLFFLIRFNEVVKVGGFQKTQVFRQAESRGFTARFSRLCCHCLALASHAWQYCRRCLALPSHA